MGRYVTRDDLKAALSAQAPSAARTAAALAEDRLEVVLADAEAEVLGKLSGRYTFPDPPAEVPGLVKGLILAVAGYLATLEWLQGKDLSDRDPVVLRYARAEGQLKELVAGVLSVDLPPAGAGSSVGTSDDAAYDVNPDLGLAQTALGYSRGGSNYYPGDGWVPWPG